MGEVAGGGAGYIGFVFLNIRDLYEIAELKYGAYFLFEGFGRGIDSNQVMYFSCAISIIKQPFQILNAGNRKFTYIIPE